MSLEDIEKRNARVEADKAWETSWSRRIVITCGTYVVVGIYLSYLQIAQAWLHALVPAMAYLLSTLGLPFLKNFWIKYLYKQH